MCIRDRVCEACKTWHMNPQCQNCRVCKKPRYPFEPQVAQQWTLKPRPWVRRQQNRDKKEGQKKSDLEPDPKDVMIPKKCRQVEPPAAIA
eukprot:13971964-Alexandrium_andersonii.AAC.1